jgi:hypothetical protein
MTSSTALASFNRRASCTGTALLGRCQRADWHSAPVCPCKSGLLTNPRRPRCSHAWKRPLLHMCTDVRADVLRTLLSLSSKATGSRQDNCSAAVHLGLNVGLSWLTSTAISQNGFMLILTFVRSTPLCTAGGTAYPSQHRHPSCGTAVDMAVGCAGRCPGRCPCLVCFDTDSSIVVNDSLDSHKHFGHR